MTIITGTNGNDILDGGTNIIQDILIGNDGSDTYIIHDTQDTIQETGTGVGDVDIVKLAANFSLSTYTLNNTNIEKLDGTLLTKNMTLTGNAATATTITAGAGNDAITGGTAADTLTGGTGNDVLNGGADSVQDTLTGGAGNDTYILNDSSDCIVESNGGGTDTIRIVNPLGPINLTLQPNVENVDATGITYDAILNGNTLTNTIIGGTKDDTLYGGNDTLADILIGGAGSDTYVIQDTKDTINETGASASDIDTIKLAANFSPSSYSLNNIKIEKLDGTSLTTNISLTGNATTATTIIGGAGHDILIGGTAVDTITGGDGNDVLYGGNDTATDILQGGTGNDTYIIQNIKDTITDTAGSNTIKLSSTFTGNALSLQETVTYNYSGANITTIDASAITASAKALTLTGNATTATTIIGGAGNDTITGGTAADTLTGGAGNDVLDAGTDALLDILAGGAGNDTYIIKNSNDLSDSIVENIAGGTDTIKLGASSGLSSFSLASYSNIENIDASALSTPVILSGNSLANTLIGTSASDIIYGGANADNLVGGKGSDLYYVDNSSNIVTEKANEGYDKVVLNSNFNSSSYALNSNIEFLDATSVNKALSLTGSATNTTSIWGTNYNDIINGGSADDILMGFSGNDTISGGAGNDNLNGGIGSDTIYGGAGKDILYGGDDSVSDTLIGGDGQDDYYLSDTKDKITDTSSGNALRLKPIYSETEFSLGKNATAGDGSKYDYSAVDFTLLDATDVSHGLILRGSDLPTLTTTTTATTTTIPGTTTTKPVAGGSVTITTPATTVTTYTTKTTSTYKNIEIFGTNYNDTIISYGGNDMLWGGGMYGDTSHYGRGNDTFYGGAGTNTLLGGVGDDVYLIDGTAKSTTITELADSETEHYGIDTIKLISTNGTFDLSKIGNSGTLNGLASFTVALASYANVENLDGSLITGTNLTLSGNDVDNIIKGGSGNDIITGGSKENTLYGNDGNDTINGGAVDDTLYGGNGNDILYGSTGVNALNGGNGDDTYKISVADEEAIPDNSWTEEGPTPEMKTIITDSAGIDTIVLTGKSSYSTEVQEHFALTMNTDIENLDASGISRYLSLDITGNALDNIITGGTGHDYIDAGAGDDTIYDYATYTEGNITWYSGNHIDAGSGNNTVITGTGDDHIAAGAGDDFVYDMAGDNTIDVGNGNNRVYVGDGDDDILTGTGDDYIIGGDGNDGINAGSGADTLTGGAGSDTLTGGAGNDTYLFSKESGIDNISDSAGTDLIKFDYSVNKNNIAVFLDGSNNLYIDYGSTSGTDKIRISNTSTIEKVQLNDGKFLTNDDINLIIQNMTTYASTNGIALNNINDVKNNNELLNLVATGWHS